MSADNSFVLLLTACIQVGDPGFVKRNVTATRLEDYKESLRQWMTRQKSLKKIVFCDNSGYSLEALQKVVDQEKPKGVEVELLSYTFTAYDERGYGFGELDIYEHALTHSRLLQDARFVVFVSGRRFIRNAEAIFKALPEDFDIVCDWEHNLAWAGMDIFIVKREVFLQHYMKQLKELTNDSTKNYAERALARITLGLLAQNYRWHPLAYHPLLTGTWGNKNIPVWRRPWLGWWPANRLFSAISRFHYRTSRFVYDNRQKHVVDRLKK